MVRVGTVLTRERLELAARNRECVVDLARACYVSTTAVRNRAELLGIQLPGHRHPVRLPPPCKTAAMRAARCIDCGREFFGLYGGSDRCSLCCARLATIPAQVGPCQFDRLGGWVAVRAPRELDQIFRRSGAEWEPGSQRWLVQRRRVGPVVRALRRATDPLFRQAGLDLDGA
jgi:hypothetical protein